VLAAIRRSFLAVAIVSVAACSTNGGADVGGGLRDPFEKVNRATFDFNNKVDEAIGKPVALAYRKALPKKVRDRVRNFIDHINSPVTFINDLLQGEVKRAQITFVRFVVNSTVGIAGLYDVAGDTGLRGHKEDFGQTLAVWGVGPGPYLVVPFLGPHTTRHLAGRVVDSRLNPFSYLLEYGGVGWVSIIGTAIDVVDQRERLIETVDEMKKTSLDFYAAARSGYWQSRVAAIRNGKVSTEVPGDDEDDEDGDAAKDDDKSKDTSKKKPSAKRTSAGAKKPAQKAPASKDKKPGIKASRPIASVAN